MRKLLCHFVMLAVLFMSVEGAADVASEGHPHSDNLAHQLDADLPESPDTNSNTDPDRSDDHCEHCCHGHVVSITVQLHTPTLTGATDHQRGGAPHVVNHAQAPPTPPPNA